MAAASRQPQDTSTTKKQVTPEQRKLFIGLGVIGALALIVGAIYLPGLISGRGSTSAVPVATNAATGDLAANMVSLSGSGEGGTVSPGLDGGLGAPATGATTTVPPQALARFRRDPFQQAYFLPTPVPTLPPVPAPPPLVDVPRPSEVTPLAIPGFPGGSSTTLQRPLVLPPVSISRLDQGTRRPNEAFPPARTLGGSGAGAGVPSPSYDKRLSGVVIADGVRAILEIQGPAGPVSHVVQPGDEVEGITVLNIQRFNDGTRTVTRMLIRENGEERTVDLRAGVPLAQGGPEGQGGPEAFAPGGP